jgi:hypothetical protein
MLILDKYRGESRDLIAEKLDTFRGVIGKLGAGSRSSTLALAAASTLPRG